MRVVSLVAGIALLVTGLAVAIGRRAEVGATRDQRLESSAELLTEQLDATVARVDRRARPSPPPTRPIERLADATRHARVRGRRGRRRACSSTSSDLGPGRRP